MLNINKRISLSRQSKRLIKKLRRKDNGLNGDSWKNIHKSVKNELSKKLLFNHSPRCVYCERYFIAERSEIDHFAHKARYPQFTFITPNLYYSCNFCNSSNRKGQKQTIIGTVNAKYNLCNFLILHPYFDNPDDEIKFKDRERVDFDWNNCTIKGKETIKFWKWDDTPMTLLRAQNSLINRLNPLTSDNEIKLIQEIISYKL